MGSRLMATVAASLLLGVTTPTIFATETPALAQESVSCTQVVPQVKDDTQNPPVWVDPSSVSFALGNAAFQDLPQDLGPVPAGPAYLIGASQVSGVPWLGVNTMHPSLLNNTEGDVTWELTGFSGPGAMYVFTQGGMGQIVGEEWFTGEGNSGSGSVVVERNRHVHPNWLFSEAGTYEVTLSQTVQLQDGTEATGSATLTFEVDTGSGNATDGHFDFGPTIGSASGDACGSNKEEEAPVNETTNSPAGTNNSLAAGGAKATEATEQKSESKPASHSQSGNQTSSQSANHSGGQASSAAKGQQPQAQASKQLPNTGTTVMTAPIAIMAIGFLTLGAGLVFTGRYFRWF